ncbi:MAG: hypothetical protein M1840_007625 [Geoglossum simile]|nr:MAG: hypothetical protein M1840_007625 [Geoglossum simile]
MQNHKHAVEKIAASVQHYFGRREPFRIYHGSTNNTRPTEYQRGNTVDISDLSRVLKVDVGARTALVEPNVPMDRLIESTMEHGLIPLVVMEFPGITTGGGFAGTAGESSSYKYGYFSETINSVEIILGNGDIITASEKENTDLFHGAPGAAGSLGITTLLELQLKQAKKYVKATYHPVRSIPEAIEKIRGETLDPELDYVEGILFSKEHGVVVTGSLTDDLPATAQVQRFSDASDPWYYLHIKEKTLQSAGPVTEYIPLAEYLFRYDRGGFWVGEFALKYFKLPFNHFARRLLDDFLHARMLYKILHGSGLSRNFIIQDLALPFSTAEKFINYTTESFGIWPLWLCPLRQTRPLTLNPHPLGTEADGETLKPMLNVGLWGVGPTQHDKFVTKNRELEHKVCELGGMKVLYAHTYYEENEFWEMFDRQWYDGLRRKYKAESLPSLWHKVRVDPNAQREAAEGSSRRAWMDQFKLLSGIQKAVASGEYLTARNSSWKKQETRRQGQTDKMK